MNSSLSRDIVVIGSQPTIGSILEGWFHQNILLQGYSFNLEWDYATISNKVVIYLELFEINLHLINDLKSRNNKIVLFHFGDEIASKFDEKVYEHFDLILRNYYFEHIFSNPNLSDRLIWVPNGFKTGVGPRDPNKVKLSKDRKIFSSFLGWINNPNSVNNERQIFSEVAPLCAPHLLVHQTPAFGQGMSSTLYGGVLESSIFTPCPAGNSAETIRLYDALECGCIPISLKHPFLFSDRALSSVPFPLIDSWNELPTLLKSLKQLHTDQPDKIIDLQKKCLDWWGIVKSERKIAVQTALYKLSTSN